ncbi:hypothetical protein, partial [Thermocatellispora tengchongensis]|uniref:hypothetical protein n=1 Tax=Thermocatellispora tengchongensis TaxID=1073253 RepID=UPI0031F02AA7
MTSLLAACVGTGLLVTSCGLSAPASTNGAPSRDEAVVIGTRLMAETLDPQQASNATNEFYNAPVYN